MPIFRKLFYVSYPLKWGSFRTNITLHKYPLLKKISNMYRPVYFAGGEHDQKLFQQMVDISNRIARDKNWMIDVDDQNIIRSTMNKINESPIYEKEYYMMGYRNMMLYGRLTTSLPFLLFWTAIDPSDFIAPFIVSYTTYRVMAILVVNVVHEDSELVKYRLDYELYIAVLKRMVRKYHYQENHFGKSEQVDKP